GGIVPLPTFGKVLFCFGQVDGETLSLAPFHQVRYNVLQSGSVFFEGFADNQLADIICISEPTSAGYRWSNLEDGFDVQHEKNWLDCGALRQPCWDCKGWTLVPIQPYSCRTVLGKAQHPAEHRGGPPLTTESLD